MSWRQSPAKQWGKEEGLAGHQSRQLPMRHREEPALATGSSCFAWLEMLVSVPKGVQIATVDPRSE